MSTSPPSDTERPVIAVATTGIFCRPGCPASAPKAENVTRLPAARAALFDGYRVIRRDGEVGQYGGGRWRKEWLLAHERRLSTSTT